MQEIEPHTFRNVVRMRAVFHIVSRERERVCSGGGEGGGFPSRIQNATATRTNLHLCKVCKDCGRLVVSILQHLRPKQVGACRHLQRQ